MGLRGKESKQIEIKCDDNLFFEVLRYGLSHVSKLSPETIQGCDLVEGQWGAVGCVICWNFNCDGKENVAKEMISVIDEKNRLMEFKVIEGDMMKAYKSFVSTFQSANNTVTWTIEYEKTNENVPNPTSLLELLAKITRDIDINHQAIPGLAANN
ncbi:hypothetical protein Leryth_005827 [Lithospermum erythrorhizon]|uniref:Bet v I/Major latex protein domain-containing protein n=1 Tax=Lithospermum erythrorhizon TaxID=34254 RepID=A0AAV3NKH2_LITER|nr:hypothetical protein Leryth_005827 [Lithospermum erythrorhizon]